MTYEDLLKLVGQQPGFAFGSLGAAPPITEVAPPNMLPGALPGQPLDWRKLALSEAQRMMVQDSTKESMSPMVPLGMALMNMGQQMQIPPALRGQNNNLQSMANSLLAWQMNQQRQGDKQDLRRSQAIELLGKATEPSWQDKAAMTYDMARRAKADDLSGEVVKAGEIEKAKRQYMPKQIEKVQIGDQEVTFERDPVTGQKTEIGRGPKWDQNKQGMEVNLPDGTTVRMGGSQGVASPSGLQKPTMNDVEKYLLNSGDQMRMLKEIKSLYKPEYQTYEGQVKGWLSNQQEKMGIPLSEDQQRFLGDYTGYRRSAYEMQSKILNQLSGAAVTEHEAKRIKGFTVDPEKDSPTALKSKLEGFEQSLRRTVARTNYIRKHGISLKNAPDDIDKIMIQRGQALQQQGLSPDRVRQQLADEFGLVN